MSFLDEVTCLAIKNLPFELAPKHIIFAILEPKLQRFRHLITYKLYKFNWTDSR